MERTIARVTTMQSVNAKASKMEMDGVVVQETRSIIHGNRNLPSIFSLDDLSNFAVGHIMGFEETSLADQMEEVAALFVLLAQKERERNAEGT